SVTAFVAALGSGVPGGTVAAAPARSAAVVIGPGGGAAGRGARGALAALGERPVPAVCREAAERGTPVRAWSAGCATGEEAWTLALLLAEEGALAPGRPGAEILATD